MERPEKEQRVPTTADSPWSVELDALTAAPEHHQLLMENDQVRVLETVLPPGERTKVHTHCWSAAQYVKSAAHVVRYDGEGKVLFDSRAAGTSLASDIVRWGQPLAPHSLENVDTVTLRVISVEIKG